VTLATVAMQKLSPPDFYTWAFASPSNKRLCYKKLKILEPLINY